MSETKWTNDETFKFIELYQNEPVIWNPKNKYHKDKNAVNDAWIRIADATSIPVAELKKKKETLLAAYRLNHRKVQASIKSGAGVEDIFKPIWIYYDMLDAFMSNVYESRSILNTEDEDFESGKENVHPDENEINSKSVQRPVQITAQQRRCPKPVELEETRTQINSALTTLNKVISNAKQNEREDDCDLYARLLAHKLRSYSSMEREELMYEIDGLLLKKRKRNVIVSTGSPSEIILSRPSSSRTMYSSYSRPSSANSNFYSSPQAQSMNSINSPQLTINKTSPAKIYISHSQRAPKTILTPTNFTTVLEETNNEIQSQDILSQACYDGELFEN